MSSSNRLPSDAVGVLEGGGALSGLLGQLCAAVGMQALRTHEPLARYTRLQVGGNADLLVLAESSEVLRQVVVLAWQAGAPCRVLGSGANVLVSDAGYRGLVVINRARAMTVAGEGVRAESGAILATVARECVAHGLAGLEWAVGIPGTVGGAVVGNAGAWGGDVASVLRSVWVLEPGGVVSEWPAAQFEYGYRTSWLKRQPDRSRRAVILEAEFALRPGERQALEARVDDVQSQRKAKQPPGASCGSVFRNPPGDYAGRLIEAAGLKGRRCGGAQISTRHANFIINEGGATAADIKNLIEAAQQAVQAQAEVSLELEVELVGDW